MDTEQREKEDDKERVSVQNAQLQTEPKTSTQPESHGNVDRGWAWVILTGVFLMQVMLMGWVRSFGVMFTSIQTMFDAPAYKVAVVGGTQAGIFSLFALVVMGAMIKYLSVRTLTVIGGILSSLGISACFFANGILFLVFSLSVCFGLGMAMSYGPSFLLLSSYFKDRLPLALAVSNTGASLGALVMPYITSELLDSYGLRGTFLLLGGIYANNVVFSALLRPVVHGKRKGKPNDCTSTTVRDLKSEDDVDQYKSKDENASSLNNCAAVLESTQNSDGSTDGRPNTESVVSAEIPCADQPATLCKATCFVKEEDKKLTNMEMQAQTESFVHENCPAPSGELPWGAETKAGGQSRHDFATDCENTSRPWNNTNTEDGDDNIGLTSLTRKSYFGICDIFKIIQELDEGEKANENANDQDGSRQSVRGASLLKETNEPADNSDGTREENGAVDTSHQKRHEAGVRLDSPYSRENDGNNIHENQERLTTNGKSQIGDNLNREQDGAADGQQHTRQTRRDTSCCNEDSSTSSERNASTVVSVDEDTSDDMAESRENGPNSCTVDPDSILITVEDSQNGQSNTNDISDTNGSNEVKDENTVLCSEESNDTIPISNYDTQTKSEDNAICEENILPGAKERSDKPSGNEENSENVHGDEISTEEIKNNATEAEAEVFAARDQTSLDKGIVIRVDYLMKEVDGQVSEEKCLGEDDCTISEQKDLGLTRDQAGPTGQLGPLSGRDSFALFNVTSDNTLCETQDSETDNTTENNQKTPTKTPCIKFQCPDRFKTDWAILKLPMFWLLVTYMTFGAMPSVVPGTFLPPLMVEKGFSVEQGAQLLTIAGALDIVSRLVPGIVAQMKWLRPETMLIMSFVLEGMTLQYTAYLNDMVALVFLAMVYGLCAGVFASLLQLVIINFVGIQRFPLAFGLCQLVLGISSGLFAPFLETRTLEHTPMLAGLLRDVTGTYVIPYHVMGASLLFAALLLMLEPVVRRIQNRRVHAYEVFTPESICQTTGSSSL